MLLMHQLNHSLLDRLETLFLFFLGEAGQLWIRITASFLRWSSIDRRVCHTSTITASIVNKIVLLILQLLDFLLKFKIERMLLYIFNRLVLYSAHSQYLLSCLRGESIAAQALHNLIYRRVRRRADQDLSLLAAVEHRDYTVNCVSLSGARLRRKQNIRILFKINVDNTYWSLNQKQIFLVHFSNLL